MKVNKVSDDAREKAKPKINKRNILLEKKYVENLFILYNNNIVPNNSKKQLLNENDTSKENIVQDIVINNIKPHDNEMLISSESQEKQKINITVESLNNEVSPPQLEDLSNHQQIHSLPEISLFNSRNSMSLPTENLTYLELKTESKEMNFLGELILK